MIMVISLTKRTMTITKTKIVLITHHAKTKAKIKFKTKYKRYEELTTHCADPPCLHKPQDNSAGSKNYCINIITNAVMTMD